MFTAVASGTPWAVSPLTSALGRWSASPRMIRVKKMPMESTCAEFWNVVFMPDPAPRSAAGRLFMTPVRFDEPNDDMHRPVTKSSRPNSG